MRRKVDRSRLAPRFSPRFLWREGADFLGFCPSAGGGLYTCRVAPSDDDVPAKAGEATDDTTAAELAPPATMDDDRTTEQKRAVFGATMLSAGQQRRPTVLGLAPPANPPAPTLEKNPFASDTDLGARVDLPSDDPDGTTETTPRLRRPKLPLAIPGSVEIKNLEPEQEEPLDETEVRTLPGQLTDTVTPRPGLKVPPLSPRPAAGRSAADDSRVSPVSLLRSGVPSTERDDPPTSPAVDPPTAPRGAVGLGKDVTGYEDDEESITARGPQVELDESITARAPGNLPLVLPPIEDATEGTTKKVRRKADSSLADSEPDSITNKAPGHLTNMLRVIASDGPAGLLDEDELPQNKTQVMANAPVRPPLGPAAARLDSTSDSALRVTGVASGTGERASLGVLGVRDGGSAPPSGQPPVPMDLYPPAISPVGEDAGKKPPYAAIVVIVMAMSIAIPVALYFFLNQSSGAAPETEPEPEPPASPVRSATPPPAPDIVPRTTESARPKKPAPTKGGPKRR